MMKLFTLKGLFLTAVFMLLGCLSIQAADDDLITKQITIKLDKAGTLRDKIGSSKKYKITNLKVIGEINGSDLLLIRDMAGIALSGYSTDGNLSNLDLSETKIVEGGSWYYKDYDVGACETSNDCLGKYAFYKCRVLTNLTLPSSITSIGDHAFLKCWNLTSLTIPSSVTRIGQYAFQDCSDLTSLVIPPSVNSICQSAFLNCSSLTSLTIPFGVTVIDKSVFEGCSGLTNLTIPSSVTSIELYAFKDCSGLTNLTIPSSVARIGGCAFKDCSGLISLTISSSIASIDGDAFKGCRSLTSVHCQIDDDDIETYLTKGHPAINVDCGIEYYLNDKKITSVVIPSTITKLGYCAFQNCKDLTSVTVSWQSPISAGSAFAGVDKSKCTLYIPQGTEQDYWLADVWGDFGNIVEYDVTGIDKVTITSDAKEVSRYSVNGQRLSTPAKGLNIVKYSDGSVKKVAIQ